MDPNATWNGLLQAFREDDWSAAIDFAEALAEWLNRGGFPPQILTEVAATHPFHRRLARSVCNRDLETVEQRDDAS